MADDESKDPYPYDCHPEATSVAEGPAIRISLRNPAKSEARIARLTDS